MRSLTIAVLGTLLVLITAGTAQAVPSALAPVTAVDLEWYVGEGSLQQDEFEDNWANDLAAGSGEEVQLDLFLTLNHIGLAAWGISIEFDSAQQNALDFVSARAWNMDPNNPECAPQPDCLRLRGSEILTPLSDIPKSITESDTGVVGLLATLNGATLGADVPRSKNDTVEPVKYRVASVVFETNEVATTSNADAIFLQEDAFVDGAGAAFKTGYGDVTTNATITVPEPGVGLAALSALGTLGWIRRRR